MERVVTYLYPDSDNAAHLKVFQDRTNQIRAFYFTRDHIKAVGALESGTNYAVYFLFDQSADNENTRVYVGQSINGANRIQNHQSGKSFWTYCIMFVTDNNSFDTLTIDYLEYYFIQKLKKSSQYSLENKDMRPSVPNISIFDKPTVHAYIEQINFLLQAEGIDLSESTTPSAGRYYYPKSKSFKARLFVQDGKFILEAGSIIQKPRASTSEYRDGGRFYNRMNALVESLLVDGKIRVIDAYRYEAVVNLAFKSPSRVAVLISGRPKNGWTFFEGLDELRSGS